MKRTTRRGALAGAVSGAAMAAAAATAFASPANHAAIVLKDAGGTAITKNADGSAKAFSIKTTCFGTAGCHGDSNAGGKAVYSYDQIEQHSYHAQLGANEIRGYNPFNIDAYDPYTNTGDKWRAGAGPQGKNWVQSPGHVGSW